MITLAIEASTYRATVALLTDDRLLVERATAMRGQHAEHLMPTIDQTLRECDSSLRQVDRVVCGAGPGSFTSLRIAASIAKGIAVGRGIPVFAVSSLALIVAGNVTDGPRGARRYLAALDALRGESYVAEFEHDAGAVRQVGDVRLVASEDIAVVSTESDARAVGPEHAEHWLPRARGVALLGAELERDGPVNLAAWEPIYGRMAEAQVRWEATHGRALPR